MTEQNRVPPGDPRGGQFAATPRPEAETVLDTVYRDDEGTFHYPPAPNTYEKLLKFWSNVEIPDDSLTRFQRAYAQNATDRVNAATERWEAENPQPRNDRHQARWQQERQAFVDQLWEREPTMYATWVRPLVRLQRMYAFKHTLFGNERDKFLAQQYSLPAGPTGTAEELLDMFRVQEYAHVLHETSLDDNQKMLEQLKRTTVQLRHIRSGV